MTVQLRRGDAADAAVLGDICYRAFKAIAEAHGFAPDFPSVEVGVAAVGGLIADPRVYDIVAEVDGVPVGSNFLAEYNTISGVGPITVDPAVQNDGAGRAMMAAVMQRSQERGFAGIRLVQAGYHSRSLALYLKLGFEAREHLACLQGPAIGQDMPGRAVRTATGDDLAACNQLCLRIHGHDRGGELAEAVGRGQARVVERGGQLTGYTTGVAFFNHSVGDSNDDLKALIGAASAFGGPGFLVPTRNGELMRWCLEHGLQITQTLTLMSIGLYNQPEGAWLPSVIY
jgi:GNAT superfamily N-acetyltransferase